MDIPEDAEGRIAFISLTVPPDDPSPEPSGTGGDSSVAAGSRAASRWGPVLALAICLVLAMAAGLWLVRG